MVKYWDVNKVRENIFGYTIEETKHKFSHELDVYKNSEDRIEFDRILKSTGCHTGLSDSKSNPETVNEGIFCLPYSPSCT